MSTAGKIKLKRVQKLNILTVYDQVGVAEIPRLRRIRQEDTAFTQHKLVATDNRITLRIAVVNL
jgi:hypothetical protein